MKRHVIRGLATTLTILSFAVVNPAYVYAAPVEVTFGSTEYNEADNSKFPIGVYVNTTDSNQNYHIELKYDKNRMQYIKGGDSEEDGIIILEGSGLSSTRKYMLSFETLSGGNAYISVVEGYTSDADGSNRQSIENLTNTNVFIAGEDIVGDIEEEEADIEETDIEETDIEEVADAETAAEDTPETEVIVAQSRIEDKESENSEEIKLEANFLGNGANALPLIIGIICMTIGVVILAIVGAILFKNKNTTSEEKTKKTYIRSKQDADDLEIENLDDLEELDSSDDSNTVISVKNVTMKFKVATQNVNGIKDYFIQLLKRNISYREFFALDDVSFDVSKGEVVGIIGTNGSGKSTILKIVSGALRPTSGTVEVDRKKVQLLTLGTGFDMELTGRENVYLNGAIIGYSKAFLDEHYDEIVKFAELEDFMDEKVKNYSSGMVSRLGFAIATAGDAAEILILDEVLSVGDEFFRKKSLKRVKEMIHGGSTVLLVSHSMPTIKDNCSKVVWIEKGKLRMVGTPDVVCKAYQHMNEVDPQQPAKVSEVS